VEARSILIASPIYFYSLPSRFKTLIDRSQQFWAARREKAPWLTDTPSRKATIALAAGRPKGARLFEGAELILKYFLDDYGISMAESLHFRGKDAPDALRNDLQAVERLRKAGRNAWRDAV
jgi:FMN-dependent NADH-azoreductase